MSLNDGTTLSDTDRYTLLDLAYASIEHGLQGGRLALELSSYSMPLQEQGASFVTISIDERLRGCIGTLEAYQALAEDVAEHAHAAAFRDPRFPPLTSTEFDEIDIHISLLGKPEAVRFSSEEDLLAQIRPGIDGLILEEGHRRGTFLPSVWESLPEPREFINHLKQKAGLPGDYWSDAITIQRYTTESIP